MTQQSTYRVKLVANDKIIEYLKSKDTVFEMLFNKYGYARLERNANIFESIVSNIIGQQLSNKVKQVIYNRFISLVKTVTPENILNTDKELIRQCGISYSKISYIKELSENVLSGKYDFNNLNKLNDEDLIKELCKIKGVGKWTAEMLALFSLGRENIISYDDVALRNGIIKAKGYKSLSKQRFEQLKKKYSPYCSIASLYFYAHNDNELRWK